MKTIRTRKHFRWQSLVAGMLLLSLSLLVPGCFPGDDGSPYYGRIVVPRRQEFRWSDGGLPQVFDPAFAAAPPDTDAVRALFEGLTDYDSRTLKPIPGVATRWESTEDGRVWTFYLREEARWSTGEPVTAGDFVRSWQRTLQLGDLAPHTELLTNIVGAKAYGASLKAAEKTPESQTQKTELSLRSSEAQKNELSRAAEARRFGAEEINAHVLRVHLQRPNPNFPALVAHPVFRPVKVTNQEANKKIASSHLISNGAFLLAGSGSDKVLLQRAENYWDKKEVSLQRVEFVETRDAESALAAYHAGEVDAVTNAPFEPLALKLLAPYADYRRETYGALTYYSFNTSRQPFNDVRVREALAIAIDRERISEDKMGGATEPANRFLPVVKSAGQEAVVAKSATLNKDQSRARQLLADAGYPQGQGFPVIHLLINRNEQQRLVAEAIAAMWYSTLRIETEIVVKNWDEYEAAIRAGDYDLVRKGAVMQTADESTNISMLFPGVEKPATSQAAGAQSSLQRGPSASQDGKGTASNGAGAMTIKAPAPIETEAEALRQLTAIPIYFASSYALVKPYVSGFDSNILDAPSLKNVKIDTGWQEARTASVVKGDCTKRSAR
jgi:ABC-type oligopeptide transport system substrate-binding subunit